ncbi:TPA: glycosyltransferase family 2 protein [Serratia fonticola]
MFSLILCTLNRVEEVEKFFSNLSNTVFQVEVIIVDQNQDDRLSTIIFKYNGVHNIIIKHIKTNGKGLSRARNIGLKYAKGDFISFPDDDCFYEYDLLNKVSLFFKKSSSDFISIRTCDPVCSSKSLIFCENHSHMISLGKKAGCSFTYFFRNNDKFRTLTFCEEMGVGAGTFYGAGEETDFITKLIYSGARGEYIPDILVFHEAKEDIYNKETLQRLESYGGGYAFYIKRNFIILGPLLTFKLTASPFWRIVKNIFKRRELIKSFFFLKGCFNGWFR